MFPREHTALYAPLYGTVCSLVRNVIISVLGLMSGYTVNYVLSPQAQALFTVYPSSYPNTDTVPAVNQIYKIYTCRIARAFVFRQTFRQRQLALPAGIKCESNGSQALSPLSYLISEL